MKAISRLVTVVIISFSLSSVGIYFETHTDSHSVTIDARIVSSNINIVKDNKGNSITNYKLQITIINLHMLLMVKVTLEVLLNLIKDLSIV